MLSDTTEAFEKYTTMSIPLSVVVHLDILAAGVTVDAVIPQMDLRSQSNNAIPDVHRIHISA